MNLRLWCALAVAASLGVATASEGQEQYDVLIRGGTVYDGTGAPGRVADVAVKGDRIAAVGSLDKAQAATIIDARGMAVAPGFINMLSWSVDSLIVDGKLAGRDPPGRHHRDLRRGRVDGSAGTRR